MKYVMLLLVGLILLSGCESAEENTRHFTQRCYDLGKELRVETHYSEAGNFGVCIFCPTETLCMPEEVYADWLRNGGSTK